MSGIITQNSAKLNQECQDAEKVKTIGVGVAWARNGLYKLPCH